MFLGKPCVVGEEEWYMKWEWHKRIINEETDQEELLVGVERNKAGEVLGRIIVVL